MTGSYFEHCLDLSASLYAVAGVNPEANKL